MDDKAVLEPIGPKRRPESTFLSQIVGVAIGIRQEMVKLISVVLYDVLKKLGSEGVSPIIETVQAGFT